MADVKLSVCIPCYEMRGMGHIFLKRLLQTISKQEFDRSSFEVVISDHSDGDLVKNIAYTVNDQIKIVYLKNNKNRGSSSSNLNNALINCSGEVIKIIFQDDFFTDPNALKIVYESLTKSSACWLAHTYIHYDEYKKVYFNKRLPFYNSNMHQGNNTIGPPSAIALKRNNMKFDENLVWFMDTDFYYRMRISYDLPVIVDNPIPLVANCVWNGQVTNTLINNEVIQKETNYLLQKYAQEN